MLAGREEQRVALDAGSVHEFHRAEHAVDVNQPRDWPHSNVDAVCCELVAQPPVQPPAVRTDDDVFAPGGETERKPNGVGAAAESGEPLIAALPTVAIRAMKDRLAVAVFEA